MQARNKTLKLKKVFNLSQKSSKVINRQNCRLPHSKDSNFHQTAQKPLGIHPKPQYGFLPLQYERKLREIKNFQLTDHKNFRLNPFFKKPGSIPKTSLLFHLLFCVLQFRSVCKISLSCCIICTLGFWLEYFFSLVPTALEFLDDWENFLTFYSAIKSMKTISVSFHKMFFLSINLRRKKLFSVPRKSILTPFGSWSAFDMPCLFDFNSLVGELERTKNHSPTRYPTWSRSHQEKGDMRERATFEVYTTLSITHDMECLYVLLLPPPSLAKGEGKRAEEKKKKSTGRLGDCANNKVSAAACLLEALAAFK